MALATKNMADFPMLKPHALVYIILFCANHGRYSTFQDEYYLYLVLEYSIGGEFFTHCEYSY
jgi:hypothetical protein